MSGPRCAQALFWEKPDFRPAERIINISGRRYADCREAGPLVAVLPARDDNGDADANARLIAASPDLLEALKRIEPIIDVIEYFSPEKAVDGSIAKQIRAAIAKAEGKA
jgi:hypothetical protein